MRTARMRGWSGLVLTGLLTGCGGGPEGGRALVRADGSSTVFPITEAVAEDFQAQRREVRVTVGISGTGGGFQRFCRGETDVSNASRPISSTEITQCRETGVEFLELPIAYDGIAIVVSPANTWASWVTVDELRRLWEPAAQGQVTRWNQVRPDWPDREIHLFGPGVDSGTFDYFTEAITGKTRASRGDFTSSEDDNVLVQGVSTDELALGYFGYAYFEENRDRLKLLGVAPGANATQPEAVTPNPDTIRTGTYTPLSRPLFVYVNRAAADRPDVESFVTFYLTEAQALVREVGYVPLSDRAYELALARFEARVAGTMFETASQLDSLEELLDSSQP